MDKSKKKRENPFADYLWQTEELLWMGRPVGQRWRYTGFLPAPQISSNGMIFAKEIIKAFGWAIILLVFAGILFQTTFLIGFACFIFLALPIIFILTNAFLKSLYLLSEETVFYAITSRRILVLIDGQFQEMQHELILVAGIKSIRNYQILIWDEGQVDFFPDFVGVEDAKYLVHLVEEARGENIPIIQKSWRDTIIYD